MKCGNFYRSVLKDFDGGWKEKYRDSGFDSHLDIKGIEGRAVAQAVSSSWLPTAAPRIRVRAACGFCGGQSGTGAGFLRVLRVPLPIIPPVSP
jgi:hypothetical protein